MSALESRGRPAPSAARDEEGEYTISDLAAACKVTPRAIRFYEDQALLAPRRIGQMRIFSRHDRVRLELILRGKRLGFSLADIKEMLDLYNVDQGHVQQMRVALAQSQGRIAELEQQLQDIGASLVDLHTIVHRTKARLAELGVDPEAIDAKAEAALPLTPKKPEPPKSMKTTFRIMKPDLSGTVEAPARSKGGVGSDKEG
jgi:DNA-binding transcriptional MerR regulator